MQKVKVVVILLGDVDFLVYASFDDLDKEKVRSLVLSSFGRELVSDYFDNIAVEHIFLAKSKEKYLGMIVFEEIEETNILYLDKILVLREMQGNGLGKRLWKYAGIDSSKVCWRAKVSNKINSFYKNKSDNMVYIDGWIVYSKNLSKEEFDLGLNYAITKPETLR